MELQTRLEPIELILSDVDGVLSDGRIGFDNDGIESKAFHVRDGLAVKLWRRAGYRFGIVTQRSSQIVKNRAAELGVEIVRQGVESKWSTVEEILTELRLEARQACYVGDDLPDHPVVRRVGLGVAVADACPELREVADYCTTAVGGSGAIRETVELILKAQRRWSDVIQSYVAID